MPATKLGSVAITEALKRANIQPKDVQEVYMGNVCIAAAGQAPARQAALGAGKIFIFSHRFLQKRKTVLNVLISQTGNIAIILLRFIVCLRNVLHCILYLH